MQTVITARHLDIDESLKDYINNRLSRLERYSLKISKVHVILSIERYRYIAEVVLLAKLKPIIVKEESKDLFSSVELALDKIEGRLKKYRDLLKETKTKMS